LFLLSLFFGEWLLFEEGVGQFPERGRLDGTETLGLDAVELALLAGEERVAVEGVDLAFAKLAFFAFEGGLGEGF
jgi:hypothetical protein